MGFVWTSSDSYEDALWNLLSSSPPTVTVGQHGLSQCFCLLHLLRLRGSQAQVSTLPQAPGIKCIQETK